MVGATKVVGVAADLNLPPHLKSVAALLCQFRMLKVRFDHSC